MGPVLSLFQGGYYTDKGPFPSALFAEGIFRIFPRERCKTQPVFSCCRNGCKSQKRRHRFAMVVSPYSQALSNGNVLVVYYILPKTERRVGGEPCNFSSAFPSPFIEGSKFRRKNRREEGKKRWTGGGKTLSQSHVGSPC